MSEDSYIKFNCTLIKTEPLAEPLLKDINLWRTKLYKLNLIGADKKGAGFGNISMKLKNPNYPDQFIITGSATGKFKILTPRQYTTVIDFNIEKNSVTCQGPIKAKASSESLTHAALYLSDKNINAVIHIHNLQLWGKLFNKVPTTSKTAEYGTTEIANEIIELFKKNDKTNVQNKKIIVMGGHKGGIITFGETLDDAGEVLLSYYEELK